MRSSALYRVLVVCVLLAFFTLLAFSPASANNTEGDTLLHTPAEIVELLESSSLVYEMGLLETALTQAENPIVLAPQLHLKPTPDGFDLVHYTLSPSAEIALQRGEDAFQEKNYEKALTEYQLVQQLEPDYASILTLIGDVLYVQRKYARAIEYFEEAIARNFIDYQAHWFLADAQWAQGAREDALKHIAIAHALNINHPQIRQRLIAYREQMGTPWKSWNFSPQYTLNKHNETVQIRSTEKWFGYAIAKALWAYEPSYAESMVGPEYGTQVVCMLEEKEALVSLLAQHDETELFDHIQQIILDGFVDEFIWYEILAPKVPEALLLLPNESFMRVVEYIEQYH